MAVMNVITLITPMYSFKRLDWGRKNVYIATMDLEAHSYEVHSKDARNHIHV